MARKAVSHSQYRLVGTYERLRKSLLEPPHDGRLDRELSYWVLPSDRRLPIAFLDTSLRELLTQSLDELMSTPGVGHKKILGFFDLLRRIAKAAPNDEPFGLASQAEPVDRPAPTSAGGINFNASGVSEALWATWCETVQRNGVGEHKLGRLAPSLKSLPTVIWHTPLSEYVGLTLSEIRRLRTHGEKRIHAVLEVFCTVHEALSTSALHESLDLELTPRFAPKATRWLTEAAWRETLPHAEELTNHVFGPMVEQVSVDLGPQVSRLASERLRLDGEAPTVKRQADQLGVTRARVYQLLDDCAKVMDVRWPEGRWLLAALDGKLDGADADAAALLHCGRDLFFPAERPTRATVYQAARNRGAAAKSRR
ncbi:MAG: hypothetical protein AAGJ46_07800 [Planctomycetota bacterium]